MGDAWLVRGLAWRNGILLRRNVHVCMLVPESGPSALLVYNHSNRSELTGSLEELMAYSCGNLDFQLAKNEHY